MRLRLLRPSDRDALLAGFQRLSPESRYRRFLSPTPRLSKEMLRKLIETDDWNHLAIVAERVSKDSAPAEGLGIARFIRLAEAPDTAEAAVVVDDAVHRRGLGRLLLLTLVEAARERGIKQFRAYVLPDNDPAQRLLRDLDAHVKARVEDDLRVFELPLPEATADVGATDLIYRFLRFAGEGVIMILRSLAGAKTPATGEGQMNEHRVRRLVTGHDENGKSMFIMDGDAQNILVIEQMGKLTVTDLWETYDAPAENAGDHDNADRPVHLEPTPTGTIFRVVDFPPDSVWKHGADRAAAFAALHAPHAADPTSRDPAMHKTASVDYAMVLDGEIWAVMDTEERLMKAGDVLIQRGTNHAWSNKTDRHCRMMFVLCGARAR